VADDYSKSARADKVVHEGSLEMIKGGSSNSGNTGPTGSARNYAKSGKEGKSPSAKNWNPMTMPASTYAVGGCGHD
jgi:hypothetical protein